VLFLINALFTSSRRNFFHPTNTLPSATMSTPDNESKSNSQQTLTDIPKIEIDLTSSQPSPDKQLKVPSKSRRSQVEIMKKINAERQRNKEFHQNFTGMEDEDVVADYICALNKNFLRQGKMFITPHYVCFLSAFMSQPVRLTDSRLPFQSVQ
jgi:GRAM domain